MSGGRCTRKRTFDCRAVLAAKDRFLTYATPHYAERETGSASLPDREAYDGLLFRRKRLQGRRPLMTVALPAY
jgi:hypothetical protein